MATVVSAKLINDWLNGSPYSFPLDAEGEARATVLLDEQVRLLRRADDVRAEFKVQASEIRMELQRDFDVRLVYESNAIEGAGTSFPETRKFLLAVDDDADYLSAYTFGRQVDADPKLVEVAGHGDAVRFVRDIARMLGGGGLREVDVRNIHRMTMASEPRIAGHYKTTDNSISGRPELLTARSDDVSLHMAQLVDWLNRSQLQGPLPAAVAHAWLADIHPFEDGNGRVARLVANYILYRYGWPCLIIRSEADRGAYYDALHQSDGGDIGPLFGLFVDGLDRSLTEMSDPSFARKLLKADMQHEDDFLLWTKLMQRFGDALQGEVSRVGLNLEIVGGLAASDYTRLKRLDPDGNGWYAKVRSFDGTSDVLLWFGYQSEELRQTPGLDLRRAPSLFLSERCSDPDWIHPYRPLWKSQGITVREVTLQTTDQSNRALVRSDAGVQVHQVMDAARVLADELWRYSSAAS